MNEYEENNSKLIENLDDENKESQKVLITYAPEIDNNIKQENETITDIVNANENEQLILKEKENEEEKKRLIQILIDIKEKLEDKNNKSIYNAYEEYLNYDDKKQNIIINIKKSRCLIIFMYYFISPVLSIIYLIGVFQIISILHSLGAVLKESFKCFLLSDKCTSDKYENNNNPFDFYNYVFKKSQEETIDFNLMMFTAFLGDLALNYGGFIMSCIAFWAINIISFFLMINIKFKFEFKEDKNKEEGGEEEELPVFDYSIFKILNILLCYILLLIGIGASALLSQQILVDRHSKYKLYHDELKKEKEKKVNDNIKKSEEIKNAKEEFNNDDKNSDKDIENENVIEDKNFIGIKEVEQDKNTKKDKKSKNVNKIQKKGNKFDFFFMICLTTAFGFFGKYIMNHVLNYILEYLFKENYNKLYFIYSIIIFYTISICLSIAFYSIFNIIFIDKEKEKENKKEKQKEKEEEKQHNVNKKGNELKIETNKYSICEICGYIIFSQKSAYNNGKTVNCFKLCCESIKNCCDKAGCSLFKFFYSKSHCCCCCCCDYNEDDYKKNSELFCYCYQTKRKLKWCNKFITNEVQIKIVPYMIEYFFLGLSVIAFEKSYESDTNENPKIFTIIFISTFIFFFYLTISLSKFLKYCEFMYSSILDRKNKKEAKIKKDTISKLSNEILDGTHGILIFNCIFSLVFSAFYFRNDYKDIFFNNKNYIFIPILMNKFYYFTLTYYCLFVSEDKKGFELISGSTLISIYISIWSFIVSIVQNYISNLDVLYILQITFISIPSLIIALLFLVKGICNAICNCQLFTFLCCIVSYIFCFGGLWIRVNDDCSQNYNCKECCDFCECCSCWENCFDCENCENIGCFDICLCFFALCCSFIENTFGYYFCCNKNSCCFCQCCLDNFHPLSFNVDGQNKSEKSDGDEEDEEEEKKNEE